MKITALDLYINAKNIQILIITATFLLSLVLFFLSSPSNAQVPSPQDGPDLITSPILTALVVDPVLLEMGSGTQTVTISVHVVDPDDDLKPQSIKVVTWLKGGSKTKVVLLDDGMGVDAVAGDERFSGQVEIDTDKAQSVFLKAKAKDWERNKADPLWTIVNVVDPSVGPVACGGAPRAPIASRMPDIVSSSRYLQYYGSDFGAGNLELMARFDVVVLDPNIATLTPAIVAFLQNQGVRYVLGYISIGEDTPSVPMIKGDGKGPVYHDETTVVAQNLGIASFYVDQEWDQQQRQYITDGSPDQNMNFGGRFVIPNFLWRWVISEQRIGGAPGLSTRNLAGLEQIAGTRVNDFDTDRTHNFGFDGFFLDTLDTAGPFENSYGFYAWTANEMCTTVKFIHETYPEKILFANRGLFFYHPGLINRAFNIRPYEFTIRPYIHAGLFESYTLDSDPGNPGVSPFAADNQQNFARNIMAESNRPDGFTMFSLDYEMERGPSLYALAMKEANAINGWIEYLAPDGSLQTVGTYALTHPSSDDTSPPVWVGDAPGGVGIQSVEGGPNPGDVMLHWGIARDQSMPIKYNIYWSADADFSSPEQYADVMYDIGDGWRTDPVSSFANRFMLSEVPPGIHFFRVRAQDNSAFALEDDNTVTRSIVR